MAQNVQSPPVMNRNGIPSRALAQGSPTIERLARLGFAAKGVVYLLVGWLAGSAAIGAGGETTGSAGALKSLVREPFGRFILAAIALGLLGYALWRMIEAIRDPKRQGTDAKGIALRVSSAAKGLAYGGLAVTAARLAMRQTSGDGGENSGAQGASATLLNQPFGQFLAIAVGMFIIGYGIFQFIRAWKSKLSEDLALGSIELSKRKVLIQLSRFGIAARGVVFVMIGYFFARAGLDNNSSEARGLGGALDSLGEFGKYSLGTVAVGLIAYGIYELLCSRYRRIQVG